jgi:polyhydroxybutyrate depolymerase
LPTVTPRDPDGKRAGWQHKPGDNKDRDLKFVDAILKTVREKYKIDDKRIYATGHSNGGVFTYLLWAERGQEFAAIAPSSGPAVALLQRKDRTIKPLPVLHLAGEKDETVPFETQKRTMDEVRKLLGCETEGKEWAKAGNLVGTLYPSKGATPMVTLIHPGTHRYPDEAPELTVKFFKEHARK